MSPSLPSSGVSTELESRKPVTSHVVSSCDVPNSCRKNGSAGITSVCMIAKEMPATVSKESVIQCRRIPQRDGPPRTPIPTTDH